MVDYIFYSQSYLGNQIPEKAFDNAALQAQAALERIKRIYKVAQHGQTEEKMALCAMAEAIFAYAKRRTGLSAASVGNVSVRYENGDWADKALPRELYRKASIYLDIRRGGGQ